MRNPDKVKLHNRRASFKKNYGITIEEYEQMLESQKGGCAICGTFKPGGPGRMMVDHNHATKKVRGLLCCNCNFVIGHCLENKAILEKSIAYLEGK
jgi:hypothetical protein